MSAKIETGNIIDTKLTVLEICKFLQQKRALSLSPYYKINYIMGSERAALLLRRYKGGFEAGAFEGKGFPLILPDGVS